MIEHTCMTWEFFCLSKNSSMYMSYGPQKFLPGPARSLVDFNLRQCTVTPLKQPLWPFDMISSSKQVFYTLWTRLLYIQKSRNILFWPSYCTTLKLDNLLIGPSQKQNRKQTCCHDFFWKLSWWLLLSMQISTVSILQSDSGRKLN